MKKYKIVLEDYEVEELIITKDSVMGVITYLYDMGVPEKCIVSIDEIE